jgi:hypothetical protein
MHERHIGWSHVIICVDDATGVIQFYWDGDQKVLEKAMKTTLKVLKKNPHLIEHIVALCSEPDSACSIH